MNKERVEKRLVLRFSRQTWDKPIVYKLIKDYNLVLNILIANVLPKQESYMITDISGIKKDYDAGMNYLEKHGIRVATIEQSVVRNEEKCVHCGFCTAACPTRALYVDEKTREVKFDQEKCSACGWCVKVCPYKAMEMFLMD